MYEYLLGKKKKRAIDEILGEGWGLRLIKADYTQSSDDSYKKGEKTFFMGEYYISIYSKMTMIAGFTLEQMLGNCGVCISTNAWVRAEYRQKGLGTLLNYFRIQIASIHGFSILMCTIKKNNEPQRRILKTNKWVIDYEFINYRTGYTNEVYHINL